MSTNSVDSQSLARIFAAPITVLLGHAGTGKTNTALGLARALAEAGYEVTLSDLDVVNPYFRSSDYPELLEAGKIRLIAPVLARTTLDTPSLTGELDVAIEQAAASSTKRLVIDVGGDDDGATTIGRWSRALTAAGAQVYYVVNAYRSLTLTPADAAEMLPDIEVHARLAATAVLNTTNLGDETTSAHVAHGRVFARELSALLGLPLAATIAPAVAGLHDEEAHDGLEPLVSMPRYLHLPWE